ncbi:hypothetical protein F4604DRAFT_1933366 [Suillus subluteus]|nr:hypothetical protein F4604DRAFT_1933366 [Suillus subluteus]
MGKTVSAVAEPFAMTKRSGLPSQHHITQNIYLKLMARTKNKKKAIALPVSSPNGPKTRRGRHGVNKRFEKLQTYLGSGMREKRLEWIDSLHKVEQISVYPSTFVHTTKDKKHVERAMQEQYPHGFTASQLPIFDPPNSFSITPPEEHEEAQRARHPPFLAARFCNVITKRGQNVLITAWDGLQDHALSLKHYTSPSEANRSSTPAYHFGLWQVQQPQPMVTRATRMQTPEALKAIDKLLTAVRNHVTPKITAILGRHTPKQLERQRRAYQFIKNFTLLKDELIKRPALDFFGAFFAFAIKEGTSEITHIDWSDDINSITWLIALGEWEGGYLVLPQEGLERRIPIRPGDVFGFMARTLQYSAPRSV